jgi:hypothetical protein
MAWIIDRTFGDRIFDDRIFDDWIIDGIGNPT